MIIPFHKRASWELFYWGRTALPKITPCMKNAYSEILGINSCLLFLALCKSVGVKGASFHLSAGLSEGKGYLCLLPRSVWGRRDTIFSSVWDRRKKKFQDSSELHAKTLEKHKEEKKTCFLLSSEQRLQKKESCQLRQIQDSSYETSSVICSPFSILIPTVLMTLRTATGNHQDQ